jgi:spore maturation protein CgeB
MRIVMFYHSLISDWNHGNAHFLRGVAGDLVERGHEVAIYEPKNAWSVENLVQEQGRAAIKAYKKFYPQLESIRYDSADLDLEDALGDADLVLVHEWNDHMLVKRIGKHRAAFGNYKLLFHDTHHRSVSDSKSMAEYDLSHYDGVLAFGDVIKEIYLKKKWAENVWTWHEAADVNLFRSIPNHEKHGDLVWIGNWGDNERTAELEEFLVRPVKELGLKATVYGVRYPLEARQRLADAGIQYGGWLPNYNVPEVFSRYRVTIHVPRRPYTRKLPGIPTIRPFEALACGIPLVSAPWDDSENLFSPGEDYLVANNGQEMVNHLKRVLSDEQFALDLARRGYCTIRAKHTCSHRVDQLLGIYEQLDRRVARSQAALV